jgi:ketosteroid isomerase-like protein
MIMNDPDEVAQAARQFAAAIAKRDVAAIRERLAPGFVHRTHGGARADAEAFMQAIEQIPGEIIVVRLERLEIDMSPLGALVTGVQHAQVRVDGEVIDDRRGFVDWFVKHADAWRIQAAVDLPEASAR